MADPLRIYLLDVGDIQYGECLVLEAGGRRVLFDGGHQGDDQDKPGWIGLAGQLQHVAGHAPVHIDLLVVTHAHADHVGCLPELVKNQVIQTEWAWVPDPDLAWGRAVGQDRVAQPGPISDALAGLREEVPPAEVMSDDARLAQFLADAGGLEDRYRGLLDSLAKQGAKIVRHGRQEDGALLQAFAGLGIELLGPSDAQLALTAAHMGQAMDSLADQFLGRIDALPAGTVPSVALYRAFNVAAADAPGEQRPGYFVNLQSLTLSLTVGGRRLFFSGDMELADPETKDPKIRAEVDALRGRIRQRKPFAYAELGHHGSGNATNANVLADLGGPPLVGMSAGRASDKHPSPDVLKALAAAKRQWVRTDRNGLVTIEARGTGRGWTVAPSRNSVNDATPPDADARVAPPTVQPPVAPQPAATPTVVSGSATGSEVEVSVRTSRPVRVTITFDEGRPGSVPTVSIGGPAPSGSDEVKIAGGRVLPRLLYVTDPSRLAANVGSAEALLALQAMRAAGGVVMEVDGTRATSDIRQQISDAHLDVAGIVLVGGYDVVPADVKDTLPAELASSIDRSADADQFRVWTDDLYAQQTGAVALPISRVPDGHSTEVLFAALSAPAPGTASASGVRNVNRPFAETVYQALPGGSPLLVSEPIEAPETRGKLVSDVVYFMLHGYWRDGTRFWGETPGGYSEAMNVDCVDSRSGSVVFSGACWGALIVDVPASRYSAGMAVGARGAAESIALAFLRGGASAFVGCTGSHYSPSQQPYTSFGAPLHRSFLAYLASGKAPSPALSQAKRDYVAAMPHGDGGSAARAIEYKLVWEFTCLGLGW